MPNQFRQLFDDELKQQLVADELRVGLMGPSITSETEYHPVEPELQMDALLKLPVRTAHIERKPIQLIPWVSKRQIAPWAGVRRKV